MSEKVKKAERAEKEVKEVEEKKVEEVAEEKVEEKKKEEKKKKKAEKRKRKRKGLFSHYKVEGEGLRRLLPFCERCGIGFFMADHGNRYTCGHCGFTRYKPTEAKE